MAFVDFADLKARTRIEELAPVLGLVMQQRGDQLRGACPACKSNGTRSLVITPSKGLFYCFSARKGGDLIALACHILDKPPKDAARVVADALGTVLVPPVGTSTSTTAPQNQKAATKPPPFDPAAYAERLKTDHEALGALGISEATCKEWMAGVAISGVLRGRLALPIGKHGGIVGYVGRALADKDQPQLLIPKNLEAPLIFGTHRLKEGSVYLMRDPLDVLRAHESGIENAVAFVSDITPESLEYLASVMDEHKNDILEICA
jgi:DNA primase